MRCAIALTFLALLLVAPPATAAPKSEDPLLVKAASDLEQGQIDLAIGGLEAAADSGEIHPDAAFSRGVAYLRRALSERGKAGDYGQAAAGFREALLLRPADGEAALALEQTRLAVARRSQAEGEQLQDTLGLGERLLLSLDPWFLFWLSVAASALATVGLLLFRFGAGSRRSAGSVLAGLSALVLVVAAPLSWLAEDTASSLELGIVIAERAPLLDDAGRAIKGVAPLREATEVRIVESRGPLLRLSLGEGSSFVRSQQIRRLRIPRQGPPTR